MLHSAQGANSVDTKTSKKKMSHELLPLRAHRKLLIITTETKGNLCSPGLKLVMMLKGVLPNYVFQKTARDFSWKED